MGEVLSVSTPDAVSAARRVSFTTYVHDEAGNQTVVVRPRQRNTLSSMYPPRTGSSDPTRSSYLTTSTRISDLSDFPLPPSDEMPEGRPVSDLPPTAEAAPESRPSSEVPELMDIESWSSRKPTRMTFGGDEDAEEFLASLSGVRDR
jgi:serine/arginine repetitive matrix protein 2